MIVIKAPLRISLFGGGTDIKEYYSKHGSTIISFAVNRYIYLSYNDRPTGGYRVSYGRVEELSELSGVKHTLIKETVNRFGELPPCTLTMISDVPKGTGLGSSSAFSVALCSLVLGEVDEYSLLEYAYGLELGVNPNIGIQDFLPSIFGGFNVYNISPEVNISVKHVPKYLWNIVNVYGLLLYTGVSRESSSILKSLRRPIAMTNYLSRIQGLASIMADNIGEMTVDTLAKSLNLTWKIKRDISGVSSPNLDAQYIKARYAGAMGGKLCGAGAGGCWFFIVPPSKRGAVKNTLSLIEIPFQISESPMTTVVV